MDSRILWSYPLVFRRVRGVDSRYAYLIVSDGYVPLRRREGVLNRFLPYDVYGESCNISATAPGEYFFQLILKEIDDVSSFFQTQMLKEEYDDVVKTNKKENNTDYMEYALEQIKRIGL